MTRFLNVSGEGGFQPSIKTRIRKTLEKLDARYAEQGGIFGDISAPQIKEAIEDLLAQGVEIDAIEDWLPHVYAETRARHLADEVA